MLWLIPRLADFQKRHPRIAIEMATVRRPVVLDDSVEMTISYSPTRRPPVSGAIELLKDFAHADGGSGPLRMTRADGYGTFVPCR